MAKVYFAVAIVVAAITIALYLAQNKELFDKYEMFETDENDDKTLANEPAVKPQTPLQDSQNSRNKDATKDSKHTKLKTENDSKENPSKPGSDSGKIDELTEPKGHLKYLGEHGSPIIEGEIEELDFVPNGRDFYAHFARKRTPLVMRGAISHWPAVKNWANETYLRENYGDVVFDVQLTKKYETILPIKKTMTLNEYLNIYQKQNVYLDCPFPQSKMTQDIVVPYCLQCDEMNSISSTHLLFSNGNTSSSLHFDGYENLLSVISGRKEILIANYSDAEYFYPHNYTTVGIEAPIDPEAVNLVKYPKLAQVTFHKITIHAGDILYIPQAWWHHVRSFDSPNIAISLWFGIFKEQESQTFADDMEEEMDMMKSVEKFGELVKNAPETIECSSQNRPISSVFWPKESDEDLPKLEEPDKWTVMLNSGHKMPVKGFGTAGLFADSEAATLVALKSGYRMIDTAQANGYNESAVGLALVESGIPREDVFLVSKVEPRNLGYEDTLRSFGESLQRLQTSYIDLMLIHSMECESEGNFLTCGEGEPRGTWKDCWKALEELVKQGKIRSIGVSNFEVKDLKELREIATIQPAAVQNFFNPFYHDKETRKYCKEHNIKYMGFSTLGNMYVREGFDSNPVLTDEGIKQIALQFDASAAQVVLKWALESDVMVIPQSRNPNHIATNFNVNYVHLSDKDTEYFDTLDGKFEQSEEETETSVEGTETSVEEEKTKPETPEDPEHKKPKRYKEFIDKLVLEKKVNPEDATLYVSSDDQWIYAIDAKTGSLMWKYGTAEDGGSRCAFSLDESVVYCGTDDQYIRAFDRLDGSLIWKFRTKGAVTSSTRVGSDGTLYVGCVDEFIYAINQDGSLKWKKNLGGQVWSSPALLDGGRVVFIGSMADSSSNVFALTGDTGDVLWKYTSGGPIFASPALSKDETVMYICSFDANCYAFNSSTGSVVWVFEGDGAFQSSPALSTATGLLFIASAEGNVFAINVNDGKMKWKYQSKGEFFSTAFPSPDGNVFVGSGDGHVLALRQTDGHLVWSVAMDTNDMVYSTPCMTTDGVLYVGGVDGNLYALRREDGQLVWKFKTNGPLVGTVRIPRQHDMPPS